MAEEKSDEENQMQVGNANVDVNYVTEESYASRAARTADSSSRVNQNVNSVNNKLPGGPGTAFFTPNNSRNASSVFEALDKGKINEKDILCLHRRQGGDVQITFRTRALKEKFLALNSIRIDNGIHALQDVDKPLTFLTVYDAPYELPDLAIIKRLEPYCEVKHSRRGRYSLKPSVCNGLRHCRVRIVRPVPSYLRFGPFLVQLRHEGQCP